MRAQGADEPRVGRVQEASLALTAALAAGTGLFVSGALCEQLTLQYDYYNCERISFVMRCALGACAVPLLAGAASVASGNAGRSASGPMELAAPDDVASKPIVQARWSCGRWLFAGAMLGLVWLVLAAPARRRLPRPGSSGRFGRLVRRCSVGWVRLVRLVGCSVRWSVRWSAVFGGD